MRKHIKMLFVLLSILIFSGCSFSSTNTGGSAVTAPEKIYDISKAVWKSGDGGISWEAKDKSSTRPKASDPDVLSVAIDGAEPRNIFVGLRSGGIMKTVDGGERWEFLKFPAQKVYGLSLDSANPKVVYASGVLENRGKIWKSEDGGVEWREIYAFASDGPLITALLCDRKNPQNIYASSSDKQLIKSRDGGNSWSNIFESSSPIIKISADVQNNDLVYFLSNGGGLYRSRDGGKNIEDIKDKYSGMFSISGGFSVLREDPSSSGKVFLSGKGGIIRSVDAGETWEKITALSDPENFPVTAFAVNPQNSKEMIYGAGQTVFRSSDSGASWSTFQFETERKIRFLEYDPRNGNTIFIGFNK